MVEVDYYTLHKRYSRLTVAETRAESTEHLRTLLDGGAVLGVEYSWSDEAFLVKHKGQYLYISKNNTTIMNPSWCFTGQTFRIYPGRVVVW